MPRIDNGNWKLALEYVWLRRFKDGRVETEFDFDTGKPTLWGEITPDGIVEVSWIPMTQDLAQKISDFGEFGRPTIGPVVTINPRDGEKIVCYREGTIYTGAKVTCKACGFVYLSTEPPSACPKCQATFGMKCRKCDKIADADVCDQCGETCEQISPFDIIPVQWEQATYALGIEGRFLNKFTPLQVITE